MSGGRAIVLMAALLSAHPALAKPPLPAGERIDLNRASVVELMRLPSIGRKRAEDIVALRGRKPFRKVEDLAAVRGLSRRWIARHRALLAVGDARPGGAASHASLDHPRPVR